MQMLQKLLLPQVLFSLIDKYTFSIIMYINSWT